MMVCGTIANKRDLKRRLVIPNSTNNAAFPYYTHVVYPGETIKDIARQYDVSAESIRKANQIENDDYIKPGEKLIVPTEKLKQNNQANQRSQLIGRSAPKRCFETFDS